MTYDQKLSALSKATNGEVFDLEYNGGEWMLRAVETQETLEQFAESSADWNDCSATKRGEIAGLPFVAWSRVQVRKGDTRDSLSVIDFGDRRIAVSVDLTIFL
jgi:hypothetical protein